MELFERSVGTSGLEVVVLGIGFVLSFRPGGVELAPWYTRRRPLSVVQSFRACRRASATAWRLSALETLRAPRKNASTKISAPTTASSSNTHQAKRGTITGLARLLNPERTTTVDTACPHRASSPSKRSRTPAPCRTPASRARVDCASTRDLASRCAGCTRPSSPADR
jgi:hypothetical protein